MFLRCWCQNIVSYFPPEDPAPYARLVCDPGQTGQGPASLAETHDCVSERVSICYNPGEPRDESP